jgi:hypothetical protein
MVSVSYRYPLWGGGCYGKQPQTKFSKQTHQGTSFSLFYPEDEDSKLFRITHKVLSDLQDITSQKTEIVIQCYNNRYPERLIGLYEIYRRQLLLSS